jgi:2,4-dienoyl-CoA reductase-like NADH-dependent reductase (Old Yellow Enzyme family)
MRRDAYQIFSAGTIGSLTLSNRLVRAATWDPSVIHSRAMKDEVVSLYREVARGGVGLILTGDFPVVPQDMYAGPAPGTRAFAYGEIRIEGIDRLPEAVHGARPNCKIVAQLSRGVRGPGPSDIPSPFGEERTRPLAVEEIRRLVDCFVEGIVHMREEGFDGVELHAAHGGLLSRFLSPYTNRRDDEYGGSIENRARIVTEIVSWAKERVGAFPILIKMNCTDYVEGGTDIDTFPRLAKVIEGSGVDAIEISGGMWDCLVRTEEELGFRPVPSPEAHTRIHSPEKQSYFLKYAEALDLHIPVILTGGNRDVERLEQIVRQDQVDFIAMCRPFLAEPDLPNRWLEGRGESTAECISCNSCLYDMIIHPGRETPGVPSCLYKYDKEQHRQAQKWLSTWVKENVIA